jgi:hypothetical protein
MYYFLSERERVKVLSTVRHKEKRERQADRQRKDKQAN